jgi:hypothetical protein
VGVAAFYASLQPQIVSGTGATSTSTRIFVRMHTPLHFTPPPRPVPWSLRILNFFNGTALLIPAPYLQ